LTTGAESPSRALAHFGYSRLGCGSPVASSRAQRLMQRREHERPRKHGQDPLRAESGQRARALTGDRDIEHDPEPRLDEPVFQPGLGGGP
jgi:hypothetical protein